MSKQQEEKKKTYQFLQDFCSTLDEITVYLSKDDPIYKLIRTSMEAAFSVDTIYEKILFVRQQIEIDFLTEKDYSKDFYERLKDFVFSDLSLLMDMFTLFFNKLMTLVNSEVFKKDNWQDVNPITLLSATYFLLNLNLGRLKNIINKYFNMGFEENTELQIAEEKNQIWKTDKMKYIEFQSNLTQIRDYANEILSNSDIENPDDRILQLQITEFIKNAIKHGNQNDKNKKVRIWYDINNDYAKLIIEDEGEGFKNLEKWNEFNKHRNYYIKKQDVKNVLRYATYRTEKSTENDGGNFLFSALEYWDSGIIYNPKKNKLYAMKYFY